jgi:hypothetical protein
MTTPWMMRFWNRKKTKNREQTERRLGHRGLGRGEEPASSDNPSGTVKASGWFR